MAMVAPMCHYCGYKLKKMRDDPVGYLKEVIEMERELMRAQECIAEIADFVNGATNERPR